MPTKDRVRLTISLPNAVYERLSKHAAEADVHPARAAGFLIENALEPSVTGAERSGSTAEERLTAWVIKKASELKASGWDEHATLRVFQALEKQARDVYDDAAASRGTAPVNRLIGGIVRRELDATVQRVGKGVRQAVVKPGESALIRSYSLLYPAH